MVEISIKKGRVHLERVCYHVHHPDNTIVLELDHEHYTRRVIEVADPASVAMLAAGGVPTGPA